MIKGINYWAFTPGADGALPDPVQAMKAARDLGYDQFELTVPESAALDITPGKAEHIRKQAEKIGIRLLTLASGIAWGTSPTHPDKLVRQQAVQSYQKMLEIASWLGVETILYLPGMVSAVFIPGFPPQPYDKVDTWARESLSQLLPTAEKTGVKIGIENVWNRFLLSPLEMKNFIDQFQSPFVGSYFDVGNIMLYGHPEHWIEILGKRIFAVHLKDFRVGVGNLDGFVDLLSGDVNFPRVMSAFAQIGYKGPFTAEIVPGKPGCVEKAIAAMILIEKMKEVRHG
jgi:L-ribulose-5-phosphate 3-epimerase